MDQVAPIINSIAWPTITLLCALIFRQQLKTFVESFANKNFEAGLHGLKVTVPVQPRGKQASAKESVPTGPEPAHLPATSTTADTPTRPIATFYDEVFRDFVNFVETNATKYLPLAMSNYSKNKEDTLFQMYVDAFMALQPRESLTLYLREPVDRTGESERVTIGPENRGNQGGLRGIDRGATCHIRHVAQFSDILEFGRGGWANGKADTRGKMPDALHAVAWLPDDLAEFLTARSPML